MIASPPLMVQSECLTSNRLRILRFPATSCSPTAPVLQISSTPMMHRPNSSLSRIDENCNGIVATSAPGDDGAPKLCRHESLILRGAKANNGFLSASHGQPHKLSLGEWTAALSGSRAFRVFFANRMRVRWQRALDG
jgi:hypothetical protein